MPERAVGQVHGRTIELDVPLPSLDGRRVSLSIEPLEGAAEAVAPAQTAELWHQWREHGPQGPIDDDGEPEFP